MPKYTIKKGDTLSQIAKKEGTTVAKLMELNPQIKDKNMIMSGANLNLPYNMSKLESDVKSASAKSAKASAESMVAGNVARAARAKAEQVGKNTESLKKSSSKKLGSFGAGVATGVAGTAAAGAVASKIAKNKAKEKVNLPKTAKAGKSFSVKDKMIGVDIQTMKAKMKKVVEPVKKLAVKTGSVKSAIAKAAKPSAKVAASIAGKAISKKVPGASRLMSGMMKSKVKK